MKKLILALLISPLLIFNSCKDDLTITIPDDDYRYFRLIISSVEGVEPSFIVRANKDNSELIELINSQLSLPKNERNLHINGIIISGNGGYNYDWSWSFEDGSWNLVEISIELCDGNPNYVEENLDYFINNLDGHYCPWSSIVDREMLAGEQIN